MSNSLKAIDVLSTKGFIIPSKPTYEIPALPRDITDLNDDDLMELFVELTSWNDYVAPQLAVAAIDEREADRYVSVLEATAMVNHWKGASGERVTIAKANIVIDPKVIEAKEELDDNSDTSDPASASPKAASPLTEDVVSNASVET